MAQTAKSADEEAKAEALRAYQKGMAHYNLNEFDDAIKQFESGYRAVPQAVFLYNIAQAHRLADRPQKALEFYRKYLKQDPAAKNFREVQDRIEALEKLIADSGKPPSEPMPPAMTATPVPTPAAKPAPAVKPAAAPAAATPRPAPAPAAATPRPAPAPGAAPQAQPQAQPQPQPQIELPAAAITSEPAPAPLSVSAPAPARRSKVLPIVLGVVGGVLVVGAAVGLGVYFGTRGPQTPIWQAVTP